MVWKENRKAATPRLPRLRNFCSQHLNFYRIHMLYFIITPLIASAIFYASNGDTPVSYTDSLFMCVSAMTVTGLNSVLLEPCTTWQQGILFILMCMGSTTSISLVTILIRLHFFRIKFEQMVQFDPSARQTVQKVEAAQEQEEGKMHPLYHPSRLLFGSPGRNSIQEKFASKMRKKENTRVDASRIRKIDDADQVARTISQLQTQAIEESATNGRLSTSEDSQEKSVEETSPSRDPVQTASVVPEESSPSETNPRMHFGDNLVELHAHDHMPSEQQRKRRHSETYTRPEKVQSDKTFQRVRTLEPRSVNSTFPRSTTIEFSPPQDDVLRHRTMSARTRRPSTGNLSHREFGIPRTRTSATQLSSRHTGFGGFPNPFRHGLSFVADSILHRSGQKKLSRTPTTLGRTVTFQGQPPGRERKSLEITRTGTIASVAGGDVRAAPYIDFDAVVGRNSRFIALTGEQQKALGGVEYRALTLLWKIVAGYWLGFQLAACLLASPYLSLSRFGYLFGSNADGLDSTWYTFFNIWSAFSNNGMSLLDSSMTPFAKDSYWPLVMMVQILAGNTAYPVFLRLLIWILAKLTPETWPIHESLVFLLDHPRRCFLYLFPSHQTWILVFVLIFLNSSDWLSFLILDINNAVLDAIPVAHRVLDGLFQATAVRSAGFSIVNIAECAPAVQVLYVIMMYIAVYPIALSIRSTNVYEEKSMGLYEEPDEDIEANFEDHKITPMSYLAYHARKQLAFDLWWLVGSLFIICIIERTQIADPSSAIWFNEFTVIFELTSAYGTVGLSLGSPVTGTSLVGSFRKLSKLVLCAVMIRGRHRGLPIAIDRAVLLPSEMTTVDTTPAFARTAETYSLRRTMSRPASTGLQSVLDGDDSDTDHADDGVSVAPPRTVSPVPIGETAEKGQLKGHPA